jgi:hypothetical protein
MAEGYYPEEPDSIDDQLDELLCEYVDGTMDPAVKLVFEEYLEENPDLAAHVRCLCETRNMLCRIGECGCATATQTQLRVRLASELARRNRSTAAVWSRLGNVAFLTSTVGLVLILGMMAGISVVQQTLVTGTQETAEAEIPAASMAIPTDAHGFIRQSMRLESLPEISQTGIAGPVTSLPVVAGQGYMTPLDRAPRRMDRQGDGLRAVAQTTFRDIGR